MRLLRLQVVKVAKATNIELRNSTIRSRRPGPVLRATHRPHPLTIERCRHRDLLPFSSSMWMSSRVMHPGMYPETRYFTSRTIALRCTSYHSRKTRARSSQAQICTKKREATPSSLAGAVMRPASWVTTLQIAPLRIGSLLCQRA